MRVYVIQNSINGHGYVGQTQKTLSARLAQHQQRARHGSLLALHKAMREFGPEAFSITLLQEVLSRADAKRIEKSYVATLGQYNSTPGGDGAGARFATPLQVKIVRLVKRGYSNRAVAKRLRLAEQTVKNYLRKAFRERGIHSRQQLG